MYKLKIHTAKSNPLGLPLYTQIEEGKPALKWFLLGFAAVPLEREVHSYCYRCSLVLKCQFITAPSPSCPGAAAVWCNRLAAGHSHFLTVSSKGRWISTAGNTTVRTAHGLTGFISATVLPFHLFSTETSSTTESFKKKNQQILPIHREIWKLIISYVVNINKTPELFKILCSRNWNSVTAMLRYITKD